MKNIYSQKAGAFFFFFTLFLFSFNALAQVGIGTTDPKTTLDVNGAISLRKGPDIFNLVPGNNDDLDLGTEPYSFYRIGGSGADFSITGIIPVADSDGQIVVLQNNTNWEMTISHENNNSSEINRIYVPGEKDLILRGRYTTITFQYNATLNRWVLQNKLNSIETWYTTKNVRSGHNTYEILIPQATINSSVFINVVGPVAVGTSDHLFMEYIEAQAGKVIFRVYKDNSGTANNIKFAITINKI